MRAVSVLCVCLAATNAACSNSDSSKPVDNSAGAVEPTPPANVVPADVSVQAVAVASNERLVMAGADSDDGCQYSVVANCVIATCSAVDANAPVVDYGTVTVTSAILGTGPMPVTGSIDQMGDWPAGDVIRLQGSGGADIPAFDVTTSMSPTVTSLAFDGCADETGDAPCPLPAAGSIVSWSGGGNANISVKLSPRLDTGAAKTYATCTYPVSAGKGRLPGAVIAALPASTGYLARSSTFVDPPTIVQGAKYRASVYASRILIGKPIAVQTPGAK